MSASYEVVLLHKDLEHFAREVTGAIRTAASEVLPRPDLLDFHDELSTVSPDSNVVVVYLGSTAGPGDGGITEALEDAVNRSFPVLPIVRNREAGAVREKLPTAIQHINAADWDEEAIAAPLRLLEMLGLVEDERKVFLSYRRNDSSSMAVQLHTELVRRRFDVFLDRFALPPGEDFQKRLTQDLGDKAFVVLLESSDLRNSQWVQHEITYAHSHRIDVLAITLPGVTESELVPAMDEAFRIRLTPNDCKPCGQLTPNALDVILERIELAHAKALRRRREQLIGSLRDHLRRDGCTSSPIDDWALLATATRKRPEVFLVTPRRPQPEDLYALHLVRADAAERIGHSGIAGAVVHEVEDIGTERWAVLTWIGDSRRLRVKRLRECALERETAA